MSETKPTAVVVGVSGQTRIAAKLYGAVSEARLAQEKRNVQHRAEQLDPTKIQKPRERVFFVDEDYEN